MFSSLTSSQMLKFNTRMGKIWPVAWRILDKFLASLSTDFDLTYQ